MMKKTKSNLDICKMAFDILTELGFAPMLDEEEIIVKCDVNGAEVSFAETEFGEDIISYECAFDFGKEISAEDEAEIKKAFFEDEPVTFECITIVGAHVFVYTLFPTDVIDREDVEDVIRVIARGDGVVGFIKSKMKEYN